MIYDVAVIGAGVFGSWTAYLLRASGRSVALVDAYGPGNSRSSSGGESRIIRMGYGADQIYTRSAMRSLALWRQFCETTGHAIFHQTGVLWTAAPGDAYTQQTRRVLEHCGVKFDVLQTADLATRFPQMRFAPGTWGIFEPESGALMARRAVAAVTSEGVGAGVSFLHAAVAAPAGAGKLSSVRTAAGGEIRAGAFVFACGAWLGRIFPQLFSKRIEPTRQEAFFFGAPPGDPRFAAPAMPVWIDFSDPRGPYGFPDLENRGVKIALDQHGPRVDPETLDRVPSTEGLAAARVYLGGRFPALRHAPLLEARVCQYENTSNGDFLVDRHPDFDNVWLVGGGSGHGFKHAPAVGESAAAQILGAGGTEPRYSLASKQETHHRTVY
ncbi:MAG TPA: FAD-dependent oxidoreductase [Bryobacteraceae bacterium]|nr:FAD-dependent oxidoreductase [Bryobacteraceae bacterium]